MSKDSHPQAEARWFGMLSERKRFLRMNAYRTFPLFVRSVLMRVMTAGGGVPAHASLQSASCADNRLHY